MNRAERTSFTTAILKRVRQSPWVPTLRTAETITSGTTPTVQLAGEADSRQANALGDPAGVGETVWCLLWNNVCLVLGRAGGSRRLGYAEYTSNQTGISAATDLTGLTVDVVVTQPGRSLRISAQTQLVASNATGQVIGRIQQDGVTIGRWARYVAAVATDGRLQHGAVVVDDLDPGGYEFNLNLECTTSGTVDVASATVTSWILVEDIGNS